MSKSNFSEEFKRDAVRQHSLYEWKKKFAASNAKGNDEAEERDILKKAAAYFIKDAK